MDDRTARGFGAAAALGGVLAIVASVPSRWFGAPQTDAYLFDPAAFSPLWIERTLVPLASVLAGVLVVLGVAGLVARDRGVAGRLRRFGGYTAVAGLALVVPALVAFAFTRTGTDPIGALVVVLGVLSGLVGAVLAVPALVAAGYGYVRAGRPVVGYGLVAGPLVAVVLSVGASALVDSIGFGLLPAIALFAVAPLAVGYELWTHPAPVGPASTEGPAWAATGGPAEEEASSGHGEAAASGPGEGPPGTDASRSDGDGASSEPATDGEDA